MAVVHIWARRPLLGFADFTIVSVGDFFKWKFADFFSIQISNIGEKMLLWLKNVNLGELYCVQKMKEISVLELLWNLGENLWKTRHLGEM